MVSILYVCLSYVPYGNILAICMYRDGLKTLLTGMDEREMIDAFLRMYNGIDILVVDSHTSYLYLCDRAKVLRVPGFPAVATTKEWTYPIFNPDGTQGMLKDVMYFTPPCRYFPLDVLLFRSEYMKGIIGSTIGTDTRYSSRFLGKRVFHGMPKLRAHTFPWHSIADRTNLCELPEIIFDLHKFASLFGEKVRYNIALSYPDTVPSHFDIQGKECEYRTHLLVSIFTEEIVNTCSITSGDTEMDDISESLDRIHIENPLDKLIRTRIDTLPNRSLHTLNGNSVRKGMIEIMGRLRGHIPTPQGTFLQEKMAPLRLDAFLRTISKLYDFGDSYRWVPCNIEGFLGAFSRAGNEDDYCDILFSEYLLPYVYWDGEFMWAKKSRYLTLLL